MEKICIRWDQWDKILDNFSEAVREKKKKKVDYYNWRILCCLASEETITVRETPGGGNQVLNIYGPKDSIAVSTSDNSFGQFLAENYFYHNSKENKEMKGFNFDFGPCTGDNIRMSMYGIAVKNAAGTYVSYNPKSGEIIDVDILNFNASKFMYKMPVALKDIAVGDIIIHNRKPVFVTEPLVEGATTINCVDVFDGEQKQVILTTNMFGFNFVTKVVSFFNMMNNNAPTPDSPFGNMLPFMLMGDNEEIDPVVMMLMAGGKMDMKNPMLLYLMARDSKSDMLPLFLLMNNI